jgi:hypothetical protein
MMLRIGRTNANALYIPEGTMNTGNGFTIAMMFATSPYNTDLYDSLAKNRSWSVFSEYDIVTPLPYDRGANLDYGNAAGLWSVIVLDGGCQYVRYLAPHGPTPHLFAVSFSDDPITGELRSHAIVDYQIQQSLAAQSTCPSGNKSFEASYMTPNVRIAIGTHRGDVNRVLPMDIDAIYAWDTGLNETELSQLWTVLKPTIINNGFAGDRGHPFAWYNFDGNLMKNLVPSSPMGDFVSMFQEMGYQNDSPQVYYVVNQSNITYFPDNPGGSAYVGSATAGWITAGPVQTNAFTVCQRAKFLGVLGSLAAIPTHNSDWSAGVVSTCEVGPTNDMTTCNSNTSSGTISIRNITNLIDVTNAYNVSTWNHYCAAINGSLDVDVYIQFYTNGVLRYTMYYASANPYMAPNWNTADFILRLPSSNTGRYGGQ